MTGSTDGGYGVALFSSSSVAMRAEAVLKRANFTVRLIPTPREISSDCGVALRFDLAEADRLKQVLQDARVECEGVHPLPPRGRHA